MTSKYLDPIPPIGEDYIEYAIKRKNLSVRRTMLKTEEEIRIVKAHAVGANLYLTVRRPVDPYATELDEEDNTQWENIPRIHKRFSVAQVLKAFAPNGLTLQPFDEEATDADKKAAILDALAEIEIGAVSANVDIVVGGSSATIKSTKTDDLMWWGQGKVNLVFAQLVER